MNRSLLIDLKTARSQSTPKEHGQFVLIKKLGADKVSARHHLHFAACIDLPYVAVPVSKITLIQFHKFHNCFKEKWPNAAC